ncbi:DUF4265 domain-containing protein [Hymenobacter sp. ISL-91]|uniref:DUF4265 domain-containing protein n=1 Tax=Hymenobacter sp. ISL-91 TaxID=2819151 RepID=UPI001BEAACE8|nr:DUF4265 domain-containing protein [Hymenobacter sp. ISL-91]MBT2557176.1 DUF4265 domain-containing protein [Hymenobacter sp. ISL-91]
MNCPERIELILTYKHDSGGAEIFTEKVDAVKIGDYYKLVHIPAFAPNIAYGDIVKVELEDGEFHFDELIEESGYSVTRVVVWKPECKSRVTATLDEFGCGVNTHIRDNYVVVSIPPEVLYSPIRAFLLAEELLGNIDFGDCLSGIHATQI